MSKLLGKQKIEKIFGILAKLYPNPMTELNYTNYYTLLVAVVLSAQATDRGVNKATNDLFNVVRTPIEMVNLGDQKLTQYVKSIGLYKNKVKNVLGLSILLAEKLVNLYGNKNYYSDNEINSIIPNNLISLIKLPGVGRKTANVILNQAFGLPTIAVDTHVFRVSKRLGLSNAKEVLGVEKDLLKIVPEQYSLIAHQLLILFGRYICKAKGLNCTNCPLITICLFQNKVFK